MKYPRIGTGIAISLLLLTSCAQESCDSERGIFALFQGTAGDEVEVKTTGQPPISVMLDSWGAPNNEISLGVGDPPAELSLEPGGGFVLYGRAEDPRGIRVVEIWEQLTRYCYDPETELMTQSGPGLLSGPLTSFASESSVGEIGNTAIYVSTFVHGETAESCYSKKEYWVVGKNYGGPPAETPRLIVHARGATFPTS